MAKNALVRAVNYVRHDVFEQFMRLLTHPQQTWRYHQEYYRNKPYAWAYITRDFLLKFNPLSVMLSAMVYGLYYPSRLLRHPIVSFLTEKSNKWLWVFGFLAIAPNILPVSLLYVPYKDFGNALGFSNFFPYEMAIATVVMLIVMVAAVVFYAAKKYSQSDTEKNTLESTWVTVYAPAAYEFDKTASIFSEEGNKPLAALDNPAKQFSGKKYCINSPYFCHYTQSSDEYSKSNYVSNVLRHLASTRHRVKSAIERADMKTLSQLFGSEADVGHTNTMTRAEAWLNDVSKPALQAVYEKIKENDSASDNGQDVDEPDTTIIDNLTKCFNESTPESLRYSAYLDLRSSDGTLHTETIGETLNKEIKPMFGPFTKNKR